MNSEFRVTTAGWNSVAITTYSSSAATVPEPDTSALLALGLGLLGVVSARRRTRRNA